MYVWKHRPSHRDRVKVSIGKTTLESNFEKGKDKMRVAKVRVGILRVEVRAKHAST